jgi:hypothetical protein
MTKQFERSMYKNPAIDLPEARDIVESILGKELASSMTRYVYNITSDVCNVVLNINDHHIILRVFVESRWVETVDVCGIR